MLSTPRRLDPAPFSTNAPPKLLPNTRALLFLHTQHLQLYGFGALIPRYFFLKKGKETWGPRRQL